MVEAARLETLRRRWDQKNLGSPRNAARPHAIVAMASGSVWNRTESGQAVAVIDLNLQHLKHFESVHPGYFCFGVVTHVAHIQGQHVVHSLPVARNCRITRSISQALRIKLSPQEEKAIARKQTENAQAYDYYLRGRQFFHQFRRKGFDFARQMFARGIVIDPKYARAFAGVTDCRSFLYMYWDSSEDNLNEAEAASHKALELDPELAEAHAASGLAFALRKDFAKAQKEFETAIQLDPKLYEAYYFYARTAFQRGDLTKTAELYEQASRLNPDDYQAVSLLVAVYHGLAEKWRLRLLNVAPCSLPKGISKFTLMIPGLFTWERLFSRE